MCGIFGIVNGKKFRKADASVQQYARDAIVANSLRGMDSTGMFQMKRNGKVFWHKDAVGGAEFIKDSTTAGLIRDADDGAFTVVHNRAATKGAVIPENAHPFQHINDDGDYVIGVHNGTLTGGWDKDDKNKMFKVDSDWAIYQLANAGVEQAFKKIIGPSAFAWYSPREGEVLNLFRNSGRPMFVSFVKDEDRMLFASEYKMMEWIAERNDIKLEDSIIELTPLWMYQFSLESPREFKKTFINTNSASSSYNYKSPEETFFEKMENIFKVTDEALKKIADKEESRPTGEEQKGLTVITQDDKGKKGKPKAIIVVTAEEQRLARNADIMSANVTFYPEYHDAEENEMWGTATGDGELWAAVVRRIDVKRFQQLRTSPYIKATIIGAMSMPALKGNKTKELCVVLSHRSLEPSTTEPEVETKIDEAALQRGLKQAIAAFADDKGSNSNETFH